MEECIYRNGMVGVAVGERCGGRKWHWWRRWANIICYVLDRGSGAREVRNFLMVN